MTDPHQPSDEPVDVPAPNPSPKEPTDPQPARDDTTSPGEQEGHAPQQTPGQTDPSTETGGAIPD